MTNKRTWPLQFSVLVVVLTLMFSGCKLNNDESPIESAFRAMSDSGSDSGSGSGSGSDSGSGSGSGLTGTRSLSIDWTAPTTYDDGNPLTDLSSYKIYYGSSPGVYAETIVIPQAGITTYVIDGLAPGTYYVAMSSTNSVGIESGLSYEVSRTLL